MEHSEADGRRIQADAPALSRQVIAEMAPLSAEYLPSFEYRNWRSRQRRDGAPICYSGAKIVQ